jgi:hypothetical protein
MRAALFLRQKGSHFFAHRRQKATLHLARFCLNPVLSAYNLSVALIDKPMLFPLARTRALAHPSDAGSRMGERPLAEVGSSGAGGLLGAYCDCNSKKLFKYEFLPCS